jgi:hypothetical protein
MLGIYRISISRSIIVELNEIRTPITILGSPTIRILSFRRPGANQEFRVADLIYFSFLTFKPPGEKKEEVMDQLMPKLVLDHVNHTSLVACHFVCTTWKCVLPLLEPDHQEEKEDVEAAAAVLQLAGGSKQLAWCAPVGVGQWLSLGHVNMCTGSL